MVYVDDIIFTNSDPHQVDQFVAWLVERFSLKDLGLLQYFLGDEVSTHPTGLLLSQRQYTIDILSCHNMMGAKPVSTLLAISSTLTFHDGSSPCDATQYRRLVGNLQYLQLTVPDIAFIIVFKKSRYINEMSSIY